MRIVYMGTPEFAIPPLKALIKEGYDIAGVITAPDKPSGRGKKITPTPVKKFAISEKLKVLQPPNLKSPEFISQLKALKPDIQIVVAFRMLPRQVWEMPEYGTFNLHASLLPKYRGAAPINHAIMNGEKETGLTTFMIDENIDTGNILMMKKMEIKETDTAGSLHDKLMYAGAELVVETVKGLEEKKLVPVKQEDFAADVLSLPEAPRIFKEDCRINWDNEVKNVYNFIRGLSPYPAAFSDIKPAQGEGKKIMLKIFDVEYIESIHDIPPGTIKSDNRSFMHIATRKGFIVVKKVLQPGKKRLAIHDFLRGFQDIDKYKFEI